MDIKQTKKRQVTYTHEPSTQELSLSLSLSHYAYMLAGPCWTALERAAGREEGRRTRTSARREGAWLTRVKKKNNWLNSVPPPQKKKTTTKQPTKPPPRKHATASHNLPPSLLAGGNWDNQRICGDACGSPRQTQLQPIPTTCEKIKGKSARH